MGLQGETGPTGLQGDIGPTGPAGSIEIFGIQAELLNSAGTGVDNNETFVFDTILNQIGTAVSYDTTTGEFTLSQSGYYLINWWVSVDGTDSTVGVILSLNMNGVIYSRAAAPPVTGQIAGSALVTVTTDPVILTLTNISEDLIALEDISPQANIVITAIPV